jgi:o-succinylbenzoate synthase
MTIKKFNWLPLDLNFNTSFQTSKNSFTLRRIYLIQLIDSEGNKFYGECAPLPDFGSESFLTVENVLSAADKILVGLSIDSITNSLESILEKFNHALTVRSSIEQSLMQAIHFYRPKELLNYLPKPTDKKIEVNGLVGMYSSFRATETALVLSEIGFGTIKMKAGRENFEDDYKVIKKTRKALGKDVNLRIDVNGKWNFEEAVQYLNRLEKFNLQYVEQPVKEIEGLIELTGSCSTPIAADESIRNVEDAEKIISSDINFLILKPALIGGLLNTLKIIKYAEAAGKQVIISSAFESSLGRNNLIYLASKIKNKNAHGLTFSNTFEKDLFDDKLKVENGEIKFSASSFPIIKDISKYFEQ